MTHLLVQSRPLGASAWRHAAWLALAFSMPLFSAAEAAAAEGCAEACPKGYTCESAATPCPAIACVDGDNCPTCDPSEVFYCAPAACTSNDDCGADQVCAEQVTYDCANETAPACPPGEKCETADRAPANCTPVTQSFCTQRWQLPCTVAADCGAGFDCIPQEQCSSSGSTGSGSSGSSGSAPMATPGAPTPAPPDGSEQKAVPPTPPGTDPVPPTPPGTDPVPPTPADPPVVTCEPAGYSACVPIQVACTTDADCVAGWTCIDNPEGVCWSSPDGSSGCTPADPPKLCRPPYDSGPGGIPGKGEGTPTSSGPPAPDSIPSTPGAEPAPPRTESSGSAATPLPANPSSAENASDANTSSSSGGCSMSGAPTSVSGLAWLALGLAGVFGVRRRRR